MTDVTFNHLNSVLDPSITFEHSVDHDFGTFYTTITPVFWGIHVA